ncbi:MAG: class I SAM-dependent methyltransferase [Ruminococcaceae bacterium]|nr:class I SAM-dependent methyltransferase [Oscillospiraceae bacterium]
MNTQSSYEGYEAALSHVYDKLNKEIDYGAWADFVEACFNRFLPARPSLLLDLACGTGSMTVQLAARGYDMIGIDGSENMLSEAFMRAENTPGILWLCQDMRSFELYGTVGAVTCCLDSLNYLTEEKDLLQCFRSVHNYLDPDGLFLFDMNTPYKFEHVYGANAYVLEDELVYDEGTAEEVRVSIFCGWQNTYHEESGICEFDLSIFEELPNGTYRRSDEHQKERCYSMDTVHTLLKDAGFELLGVYSDYTFSTPKDCTERWYFVARAVKK